MMSLSTIASTCKRLSQQHEAGARPLVTLDTALRDAAGKAGVELLH
jgi:hypothetical protein